MVALYMFKLWRLSVLRAFLLARLSIVRLSAIPTYTRIYGIVSKSPGETDKKDADKRRLGWPEMQKGILFIYLLDYSLAGCPCLL